MVIYRVDYEQKRINEQIVDTHVVNIAHSDYTLCDIENDYTYNMVTRHYYDYNYHSTIIEQRSTNLYDVT